MKAKVPPIGILEGRLTPSRGRGIQFFPDDNWEQEFEDARTIDLSSIELLIRPKGLREHPLMTKEGRARLGELVKSTGVAIPSVHGFYMPEDQYATDLLDVVRATAEIGAKVILVSFFHEKKLSPAPDATWKRAHELLAPAAATAKDVGVQLGIEAELPAQTLLDFMAQAVTPEAFGVYYDLGNVFACGFPVADEIHLLRDRIVGVHIKDRLPNTDPAVESKTVSLGEGCADFKAAFVALREIGYTRPLIIQGARGEDGDELERNKTYREFIENIWQN
ncbi:MAG: sugar phosphate isomerase/epimerase [bacterium]|nr:sugar phosphate isomerase/epimerase [bacterium]